MAYRCAACGREWEDRLAAENEFVCSRKCGGPLVRADGAAEELARLPSVLAIPLGEYAAETHPVLRLHRLCHAVEILTRFCTMVALGELRALHGDTPLPDGLLRELRPRIERPTFGKWRAMLDALVRHLPRTAPLVVPELPGFVRGELLPRLPGGEEELPEHCLIALRNLLTHGGAMTRTRAAFFLRGEPDGFAGWARWLDERVRRLAFLADAEVCSHAGGSTRRLAGAQSRGSAVELPAELRRALQPLDGHVVLLRQGRWLDLWPLCAYGRAQVRSLRGPLEAPDACPLVYVRAEPERLLYAALGVELPNGERADTIRDFEALFRLPERLPEQRPGEDDFEGPIRRDAEALIGRRAEVAQAKRLVREATTGVLWVSGPGGVGKSFLLAKLADDLRGDARKVCRIAWRFKADDQRRCTRVAFFRHAVGKLAAWLGRTDVTPAAEAGELYGQLARLLDLAAARPADPPRGRPPRVLFVLDGLDEIEPLDPAFPPVPFQLARPNVVWVCAGRPERSLPQVFAPDRCTHVFPDGLPAMSADDVRAMLLDETGALKYQLLSLDAEGTGADGRAEVVNAAVHAVVERAAGLPLYVHFVVQDVLAGHFRVEDLPHRLPPGLSAYYDDLLQRLAIGDLHALLTPLVVTIAWAKAPLDAEALFLLMVRRRVLTEGANGRATLRRGLERVGSLVRPVAIPGRGPHGYEVYHPTFREHIHQGGRRQEDGRRELDEQNQLAREDLCALAREWQALPGDHPARSYVLRFGPQTLLEARRWDELEALLTDLAFLEAKASAGLVFDLAGDLTAAVGQLPAERPGRRLLRLLEKGLRRVLHFVATHPATFFQSLWNAGWWYDCAEAEPYHAPPEGGWGPAGPPWRHTDSRLSALLEGWRARKETEPGFHWVRFRSPPIDAAYLTSAHALQGHQLPVRGVAFTPDGKRLASGSHDLTVRVWDVLSAAELTQGRGHTGWVTGVAVSHDGRLLASSADDRTVRIWDAENGRELRCLTGHTGEVRGLAFTRDGGRLVSAAADGTFRVWEPQSGREALCVTAHEPTTRTVPLYHDRQQVVSEGTVCAVAVSPDGQRIATGSFDRTVRLWGARSGEERLRCAGHEGLLRSVDFDPRGGRVASAADDATVRVWAVEDGRELLRLDHPAPVKCVAFAPGGDRLATGADDSFVRVWDAETGRLLARFGGHWGVINAVAFSPGGGQLASAAQDRTIRLWQLDREEWSGNLRAHGNWIDTVVFSPDGRHLLSSSQDGTVGVWDGGRGALLRQLRHHQGPVRGVAVAPDGRQVASCGADGTVRLCALPGGEEQAVLAGHRGGVNRLAYSAGGRWLLSGGDDRTVRIWDVAAGRERACLVGHEAHVYGVAVADERLVAAGAADGTIRLWRVDEAGTSAGPPAVLSGPRSTVSQLAFTADGGRLVAVSWDKRMRVWEVGSETCLLDAPGIVSATAVAAETERTPWRAVSAGWETLLVVPSTGAVAARCLGAYNCLAAHPSGRAWAGAAGNHLVLFSLEGPGESVKG